MYIYNTLVIFTKNQLGINFQFLKQFFIFQKESYKYSRLFIK